MSLLLLKEKARVQVLQNESEYQGQYSTYNEVSVMYVLNFQRDQRTIRVSIKQLELKLL